MFKTIGFIAIGFIIGFLITCLIKKLITIEIIKKYIPIFFNGIINRFDRMLTGNDGCYSHTRFINLIWAIGGFCLVYICAIRQIKIADNVLFIIGGGMGANMAQTIMNKKQEVTQAIATINKGDSNV